MLGLKLIYVSKRGYSCSGKPSQDQMGGQLCTSHDTICVKLLPDWIIEIRIRAICIFAIFQLCLHKCFVEVFSGMLYEGDK